MAIATPDADKRLSPQVSGETTSKADAEPVAGEARQPARKAGGISDPLRRQTLRNKLPAVIKGPLDALFPVAAPSPLYDTPPSFVLEADSRSKWRNRKTFVRIAVVFLANVVLMVDQTTLRVLGKVGFFGLIVACLIPPMFPVQLFIIAAFALTFGMALGWAWGCAAMAAALRARDVVLTASQVMTVQKSISTATNPEEAYTKRIFEGDFLEWKSSLVFGVFLAVGTFAMGLLRAKIPILLVTSIFGSIIIDVMTAYGPLFPNPNYTLSTMFMVPTACYLAIAIAGTIVVFPQTVSHAWTEALVDRVISPIRQRADLHAKILAAPPPSDETPASRRHPWSILGDMWITTQEAMSSGLELLRIGLLLSELELSMGQLSAKDYRSLVEPIRELVTRSIALAGFWSTIAVRLSHASPATDADLQPARRKDIAGPHREYASKANRDIRNKLRDSERQQGHDLATLLALLKDASTGVRQADEAALGALSGWLLAQNNARWAWIFSRKARQAEEQRLAELEESVNQLEATLRAYREEQRLRLLEPFREFFDPETGRPLPLAERRRRAGPDAPVRLFAPESLITVLAASDDIITYSQSVLGLTRQVLDLGRRRRKSRLWTPTGLRRVGHLLTRRGHHASGADLVNGGENPDAVEDLETDEGPSTESAGSGAKGQPHASERKRQDGRNAFDELMKTTSYSPDTRPPRNALQRIGRLGYAFFRWWTTPDVIFALKYAAASVVLWLPQVFKSTAWLSYTVKLVWAQITAQTFMAPYAGDQILATLERVLATAIGLVYGMLMWYIGAGRGHGTRVGNAASIFVLSLPLLAARVYSSMQKFIFPSMMLVTALLVAGYSWLDFFLPRVGNPGQGTAVAWRRGLLVMIGAGVGLVFMILPPAYSSRKLVRRTHATCLDQLGRVYAAITTLWIEEQQLDDELTAKEAHSLSTAGYSTVDETAATSLATQRAARARIIAIRRKLNGAKVTADQAVFEFSLRGDWPIEEYRRLLRFQLGLLQSLSQLGQALVRLKPKWRKRLVQETAFLNQPLIADVTTSFSLISLALRQGVPLPAAMPGPLLDRLVYHDARLKRLAEVVAITEHSDDVSSAVKVEGADLGHFPLTFDILCDENFGAYTSAVEALANILVYVDEIELAAKALLGEISFPGYSMLADRAQSGDV